jgi:hypothetical protein
MKRLVISFLAVLALAVFGAFLTTKALPPSSVPDFLQPVRAWKIPAIFGQASSAGVVGVPRVQGVPGGDSVTVTDLVADSTASSTITAACADPGTSCSAGTTLAISTAGFMSASFTISTSTNIVGTLKTECSLDGGTVWNPEQAVNQATGQRSNVFTLASGASLSVSFIGCGAQSHSRIRLSVLTSGTSTGTITARASMVREPTVQNIITSPANPAITGGYGSPLVDPLGALRVSQISGLFVEPFDGGALDTTVRWTTNLSGGTATQANGTLTLATSTTASNRVAVTSKPTFINSGGTAISFLAGIKIDATLPTNVDRFWGFATVPATPTYAAPITDGVGFELKDTVLTAAVYIAGAKTTVATLTAKTDGAYHRYMLSRRSDLYVWYIDDIDVPVASAQFVLPAVQTLPITFAAVNNTSVASAGPVFVITNTSVFENSPVNQNISDPNFPFQQASVGAKAAQGTYFLGVQQPKDTGRVSVMYTASVASTATTEVLITLTKSAGLAATSTCSSCAVTTGKKFRVQAIYVSARNSTGTVTSNVTVNLRAAVGGATTNASPLQVHTTFNLPASAASVVAPLGPIADGFEIDANAGTNTFGATITHPQWVTGTQVATFDLSIIGYEY